MENSLQPIWYAIGMGLLIFPGISLIFRKVSPAYRILGLFFVVIGFNLFNSYLNQTGLMREYIHFFRSAAPTQYLFGPLGFLFVRFLLAPEIRWRHWDWLHFVPFLLHLLELIPLYSLPAAEKQVLYTQYLEGPLEDIPLGVLTFREHIILKTLIILGYQGVIFGLIKPILKDWSYYRNSANRILFIWVFADFGIKTLTFGGILVLNLFNRLFSPYVYWQTDLLYFLDNAFCALFLLANPSLVQDFSKESQATGSRKALLREDVKEAGRLQPEPGDLPAENEKYAEYRGLIMDLEKLMDAEQPFLQETLTLQVLADQLRVKPYRLSKVIKEYYGLSYSDYINKHRLDYIEQKIQQEEVWKSYSIESMAFQAGFGSRAAFYLAFRKQHEGSPADYYGLKESSSTSSSS